MQRSSLLHLQKMLKVTLFNRSKTRFSNTTSLKLNMLFFVKNYLKRTPESFKKVVLKQARLKRFAQFVFWLPHLCPFGVVGWFRCCILWWLCKISGLEVRSCHFASAQYQEMAAKTGQRLDRHYFMQHCTAITEYKCFLPWIYPVFLNYYQV